MSMAIHCECGSTVRGETEDDLVAAAEEHIAADHPEMVGSISREQLLRMAEEE